MPPLTATSSRTGRSRAPPARCRPAPSSASAARLMRLAGAQARQDHRRPAGIGRRRHPGIDRGNWPACTTPCQSNAAATRLTRSPPAAKKVATTRTAPARAARYGSRSGERGRGVPAFSARAARSARSTWARQSATATLDRRFAGAMLVGDARWPAGAAGRCRGRAGAGRRSVLGSARGTAAQRRDRDSDDEDEQRRWRGPSGGSDSQGRAQDSARNRPTAVASEASAGHSRSHRTPAARAAARARAAFRRRAPSAARSPWQFGGSVAQQLLRERHSLIQLQQHANAAGNSGRNVQRHAILQCQRVTATAAGDRARSVASTSRRGRTSAHSPSR